MKVKEIICILFGTIAATVSSLFGGWDATLITLLILMATDYIMGTILAGVFHKSKKTESGGLNSSIGWQGICRKGVTLLIVIIAHRLDFLVESNYIRDAVVVAFSVNELISIVENAGLMGIPMPKIIVKAIDVLKHKNDEV